jgi:pimeloyl-ACP methyl ester carboxylesterase
MPERVDLGSCTALRHVGDPERCVVLLPGQFYPTRAPVLWFAREAAMAGGWSTLEVLGEPGLYEDPLAWERDAAERAIEATSGARMLMIGKSLASLLAGMVSDHNLPAVWLTPLLTEPSVLDALARTRRPTLVAGGSADAVWRADAIPANTAIEVLELPGADHALQVPGDPSASLDALRRMTAAVGALAHRV